MTSTPDLEPVLTIKDVAALEQMTPHAISRKAKAGLFPGAYRAGAGPTSPWRFPQSSIAEYRRRLAAQTASDDEPEPPAPGNVVPIAPRTGRAAALRRAA